MAEQTDERTAFVVPSETFSQIVVSGLGTPLDAELSRPAGMRLWQERLGAIDMMLERSGAALFTFDLEEDTFYFLKVKQDGQQVERRIRNFSAILDMAWQRSRGRAVCGGHPGGHPPTDGRRRGVLRQCVL